MTCPLPECAEAVPLAQRAAYAQIAERFIAKLREVGAGEHAGEVAA